MKRRSISFLHDEDINLMNIKRYIRSGLLPETLRPRDRNRSLSCLRVNEERYFSIVRIKFYVYKIDSEINN